MFESSEDSRLITNGITVLHTQYKSGAATGARMLREQEEAGLGPLGSCPVAKPCRQRDARCVFGRYAAHIEHDGAEASTLQNQIGHPESLFDPC